MHRAESVLQNCVMGRCAICIFMYCYISLFTMKRFWTQFEKIWNIGGAFYLTYGLNYMNKPNDSAWVALLHSVGKKFRKNFTNNINIHKSVFK